MPTLSAVRGSSPTERKFSPARVRNRYHVATAQASHERYVRMFWLKTIGPTIGASFRPSTSRLVNCTGDFPRPQTLARYDDNPAAPARIVSARPDTVWLTRIVIVAKPCSSAPSAPANIPAASDIVNTHQPGPPTSWAVYAAVTAPSSIIPSTPRLKTPERSAKTSPSAA